MGPWNSPGILPKTLALLPSSFFADDHASCIVHRTMEAIGELPHDLISGFVASALCYNTVLSWVFLHNDYVPKAHSSLAALNPIHFHFLEDIAPAFLSCIINCFLSTKSFPLAYNLAVISFFLKKELKNNNKKTPKPFTWRVFPLELTPMNSF